MNGIGVTEEPMKHLLVAVVIALVACEPKTEEQAKRLIPSSSAKCVTETVAEKYGTGKVSFCTDGKTLAICTGDEGCITVNLPAERP